MRSPLGAYGTQSTRSAPPYIPFAVPLVPAYSTVVVTKRPYNPPRSHLVPARSPRRAAPPSHPRAPSLIPRHHVQPSFSVPGASPRTTSFRSTTSASTNQPNDERHDARGSRPGLGSPHAGQGRVKGSRGTGRGKTKKKNPQKYPRYIPRWDSKFGRFRKKTIDGGQYISRWFVHWLMALFVTTGRWCS